MPPARTAATLSSSAQRLSRLDLPVKRSSLLSRSPSLSCWRRSRPTPPPRTLKPARSVARSRPPHAAAGPTSRRLRSRRRRVGGRRERPASAAPAAGSAIAASPMLIATTMASPRPKARRRPRPSGLRRHRSSSRRSAISSRNRFSIEPGSSVLGGDAAALGVDRRQATAPRCVNPPRGSSSHCIGCRQPSRPKRSRGGDRRRVRRSARAPRPGRRTRARRASAAGPRRRARSRSPHRVATRGEVVVGDDPGDRRPAAFERSIAAASSLRVPAANGAGRRRRCGRSSRGSARRGRPAGRPRRSAGASPAASRSVSSASSMSGASREWIRSRSCCVRVDRQRERAAAGGSSRELGVLHQPVDGVDPEAVDAALEPRTGPPPPSPRAPRGCASRGPAARGRTSAGRGARCSVPAPGRPAEATRPSCSGARGRRSRRRSRGARGTTGARSRCGRRRGRGSP